MDDTLQKENAFTISCISVANEKFGMNSTSIIILNILPILPNKRRIEKQIHMIFSTHNEIELATKNV